MCRELEMTGARDDLANKIQEQRGSFVTYESDFLLILLELYKVGLREVLVEVMPGQSFRVIYNAMELQQQQFCTAASSSDDMRINVMPHSNVAHVLVAMDCGGMGFFRNKEKLVVKDAFDLMSIIFPAYSYIGDMGPCTE